VGHTPPGVPRDLAHNGARPARIRGRQTAASVRLVHRVPARAVGVAAIVLVLAACTQPSPRPSSSLTTPATATATAVPTPTPTRPTPSPTGTSTPSPSPSPTLEPGDPCDPADGSPDCTDATGTDDGEFRYVEGYAQCVADLGSDEAYGLCTDLDGDGRAGYADSG